MQQKNDNMEDNFLSRRYANLLASQGNDLSDIRPFVSLMKEFAGYAITFGREVIPYVEDMQQLLYGRGLLPCMIKNAAEYKIVEELSHGLAHDFMLYVYLAYKHVEEDWKWNEEKHIYNRTENAG